MEKKPSYNVGGQAVIEGVMMRGKDKYVVAVRNPEGNIVTKEKELKPPSKIMKMPIIRGIIAFVDSLVLGMDIISYSADVALSDEEIGKSKFELFLEEKLGAKSNDIFIMISVILSIILAIGIFMVLPVFLSSFISKYIDSMFLGVAEGLTRLGIFLLYIVLISQMKDIQRVFMYHGAEHKTINCLESGKELTVENIRGCTRLHKRCGTSFLILVVLISMIFFMFLRTDDVTTRVLTRITMVPFLAGISYEILRWAGKTDNILVRIVSYPGILLQKITTKEPDDSQIEVAIVSLKGVLAESEKTDSEVLSGES